MARRRKNQGRIGFWSAMGRSIRDFASNTAITGLQHMYSKDKTLFERLVWAVVTIVAVYAMVNSLMISWYLFLLDPTVTTLEDTSYRISRINFPGVNVCDMNKISRRRALEVAESLAKKANRSKEEMLDYIRMYAVMFEFGKPMSDESLTRFQTILNRHEVSNVTGVHSPYEFVKKLSNPCSNLISNCRWGGTSYPCEDLFVFDTTMEGFCCMFNYAPPLRNATAVMRDYGNEILRARGSDIHAGLSMVVHTDLDDYFYTTMATTGANIHIFDSNSFPETSSGGLQERILTTGVELYIKLSGRVISTVKEVKKYPIANRMCKFVDESSPIFGKPYTFANCILECRLHSVLALCECIPFNYINAYSASHSNKEVLPPQCTLLDVPCLNKYKDKWRVLNPFDYDGDDLNPEKENSVFCKHCVSSCEGVIYHARKGFTLLNTTGKEMLNYSILHVFFETDFAQLFRQDVVYYWFEITSDYGGMCSLLIGFSLITAVEFAYFFTIRLARHILS